MGWKGRGRDWSGPWPGRGPFSNLPPWQRPGWLYGRGACWWLLTPQIQKDTGQLLPTAPLVPKFTTEQERQVLEQQVKALESQLDVIRKRLGELKKVG